MRHMIITLCGSARFEGIYHELNKQLTLAGHAVFSLATFPSVEGRKDWCTMAEKDALDTEHERRIRMSDAIVVINKNQYIGDATQICVGIATCRGIPVYYWEHPVEAAANIGRVEDLLP